MLHCLRLDSVILTGWYCWLLSACMLCLKISIWEDVHQNLLDMLLRLDGAFYLANSSDVSKKQNKQSAWYIVSGLGYIKWSTIWLQLCGSLLKMWYVLSKNRPILSGRSQYTSRCVAGKVSTEFNVLGFFHLVASFLFLKTCCSLAVFVLQQDSSPASRERSTWSTGAEWNGIRHKLRRHCGRVTDGRQ